MEVGTVLLRYSGVQMEPSWREVLAGVAVHQGADIFWALVFWGLAARGPGNFALLNSAWKPSLD